MNRHMMSLDKIDKTKYPTLFRYWQAMRTNPKQPNLVKWMVNNKLKLDSEIKAWTKAQK